MEATHSKLAQIFEKREQEIAQSWLDRQAAGTRRMSPAEQHEAVRQSREFLLTLRNAIQSGGTESTAGPAWMPVREFLTSFSTARAKGGFTPTETASFIFSLKQPLFEALRKEIGADAEALANETWRATELLDSLGLYTSEAFQKTREDTIARQQAELLELSTPVVQLWEGVLALPLIGTLDSSRTQVVMQNLLDAIVKTRSDFAIIDITGVPVVDTLVAQHLLKTVAAARLMGAECLISGIRPQIAQTIIHLGVDLAGVITKATLADAFAIAMKKMGFAVVRESKEQKNKTAAEA
ncbi:MAG TPA: STAS domain-containing protein [Bryobacteraceae bacterium]|nr:STAS domain-containing protein [Bryobacteraceae bacterium]